MRIILSIKWQDIVPDTEVLTRGDIHSIHTLLQKAQVRWAAHVTRMPDDRLPKQLLNGELCYGNRSVGGQNKRFKDTLKKTLTRFNIDVTNWEACAQDRRLWRGMIHTGASSSYRVCNGAHPSHSSTLHFCDVVFARYLPEMCAARHDMVQIARTADKDRIAEAQKKRAARKARLYSTTSTLAGPTYPCPECGRVMQARIGLISYLRTHRANQS